MKISRSARILILTALCGLSVLLMGGGNDCPKACIAAETACAEACGGDLTGECVDDGSGGLRCEPGGGPDTVDPAD